MSVADLAIVAALVQPVIAPGGLAPAEEELLSLVAEGRPIKAIAAARGVPAEAATPFFAACAWRDSEMLHGADSFQVVATPTKGWAICSSVRPIE